MSPLATTILLLLALSFFGYTMYGRVKSVMVLKPPAIPRFDRIGERIGALLKFGLGQKRMVDPEEFTPGLMHVFIFAAFLVLQVRTLMMFAMGYSEGAIALFGNLANPFWADHQLLLGAYSG